MKPHRLLGFLLLPFLSGCVTPAPRNAEVTIPAAAPKVRESAVAFLVSQQWRPTRSDDLTMVFQKDGTTHDRLMLDPGSKQQITLTLLSTTNAVRLLGFGSRLYSFGERTHLDISPGIQWHLEAIKATALGLPVPELPAPTNRPAPTKGASR